MRALMIGLLLSAFAVVAVRPAVAGPGPVEACDVCTCANSQVICLSVDVMEVLEEQVVCGNACAEIGSTHGTRQRVEGACSELPQCNGVSAPVASGTWLAAAALGLFVLGSLAVHRMSTRTA